MQSIIVSHKDMDSRIDIFLTKSLQLTRSNIQKLIEEGNITVNDSIIKSNYRLKANDYINITLPELKEPDILSQNIPLNIIYEDSEIIVINKEKGMVVHPAPGHYEDTLVNALMYHCKGSLSGINGVLRPGIVHRIDKDTSGLLVCAKNDNAHTHLATQFAKHSINRAYYAITQGGFKEDCGIIKANIARHKTNRKKMDINANGKHAITHYKVIRRLGGYTFIEAKLETGRTHQIRVHMAYIKRPLVGDTVYGLKTQPINAVGQMLHAYMLGFIHPTTGKYIEFSSVLPKYFEKALTILEK